MTTKAGEQPTITQALKPRPFCGSEAEVERYGTPRQSTIYQCTTCGCQLETGEEWGHGADWNKRTTSLAAQDQQVLALVEAARDAGDVLQSAANPSNLDPQYSGQIAALGERIGYGALMHGASALWRKSLGDLAGSEFAAGPCVSTAASRLSRLDDALMPFRGETLPDAPSLSAQDGLVEALEEIGRLAETLCEYDGEVCNIAEYILSAHRSALSAIKGDKS